MVPGLFRPASYPKYLSLSLSDGKKVEDCDIFEVHRAILACVDSTPKISAQGDGSLLIEAATPGDSDKLQGLVAVSDLQVKCRPHRSLN